MSQGTCHIQTIGIHIDSFALDFCLFPSCVEARPSEPSDLCATEAGMDLDCHK